MLLEGAGECAGKAHTKRITVIVCASLALAVTGALAVPTQAHAQKKTLLRLFGRNAVAKPPPRVVVPVVSTAGMVKSTTALSDCTGGVCPVPAAKLSQEIAAAGRVAAEEPALTREVREVVEGCGHDVACVTAGVEEVLKKPWFRRMFERSCLGRNPNALRNVMFNWTIEITGITAAWKLGGYDEYPYELLTTMVIMLGVWGEQACRNTLEGVQGEAAGGWFRRRARNSLGYAQQVPVYGGLYVGVATAGDAIRGEEINGSRLLEHVKDGTYIALVDYAFTRNIAVAFMDDVDLIAMPWLRTTVENMFKQGGLGRVIERNGEKLIVYAAGKTPGYLAELAARVGIRTTEGVIFLEALERLDIHDDGVAETVRRVPKNAVKKPQDPPATVRPDPADLPPTL